LSPNVLWNNKLENIPMTVSAFNDFIEQNHTSIDKPTSNSDLNSVDAKYIREQFTTGFIDAFGDANISMGFKKPRDPKYKFNYLLNDPAAVYQMIKFYGIFGNGLSETVSMGKVFSGLNDDFDSPKSGEKRKFMDMMYGSKKPTTNIQPYLNTQKKVVSESVTLRGDSYFTQPFVTLDYDGQYKRKILSMNVKEGKDTISMNDTLINQKITSKPIEKGELYYKISKRTDGMWKDNKDAPCQIEICLSYHYEPMYDNEMRRLTGKIGIIDYYTNTTEHSYNVYDLRGHILVNQ
jgi:hypothetical protein